MFNVVAEAYIEAVRDGAMAEAEVLLQEMEAIAGIADLQRVASETAKKWRVG